MRQAFSRPILASAMRRALAPDPPPGPSGNLETPVIPQNFVFFQATGYTAWASLPEGDDIFLASEWEILTNVPEVVYSSGQTTEAFIADEQLNYQPGFELPIGEIHFLRVRYIGQNGPTDWSNEVEIFYDF